MILIFSSNLQMNFDKADINFLYINMNLKRRLYQYKHCLHIQIFKIEIKNK